MSVLSDRLDPQCAASEMIGYPRSRDGVVNACPITRLATGPSTETTYPRAISIDQLRGFELARVAGCWMLGVGSYEMRPGTASDSSSRE